MERSKTNLMGLVGLVGFCTSGVAFLSSIGLLGNIGQPYIRDYGTVEEARVVRAYEDREKMYESCAVYGLMGLMISPIFIMVGACGEENRKK